MHSQWEHTKKLKENSILKQNFLKNKLFLPFKLLHFRRNTGPGNGNIDREITDSRMFVWEISPDKAVEIEFELNGISISPGMDIGRSASKIIGIK